MIDESIATEGEISDENQVEKTWVQKMLEERMALFDDAETAKRDEDDLPVERGASGANLRWAEVLGDKSLDRRVRRAAWRLQRKHKNSDLDAEELAQRIRLRLYKGYVLYKEKNGISPETRLLFDRDRGWAKYAQRTILNECARYAPRMEREAKAARLLISRDSRDEKDADGDEVTWREKLDFEAALDEMDHDEQRIAIENAIAQMSGLSRRLIEAYYREGEGQRTLAKRMNMALSSFQKGPWEAARKDFKKNFQLFVVR